MQAVTCQVSGLMCTWNQLTSGTKSRLLVSLRLWRIVPVTVLVASHGAFETVHVTSANDHHHTESHLLQYQYQTGWPFGYLSLASPDRAHTDKLGTAGACSHCQSATEMLQAKK